MYLRLTFSSVEIYKYLEPLYNDYRKLRYMNTMGRKLTKNVLKIEKSKLQVLSWSTWTNSSTTCSETKDIATFSCLDCRYFFLLKTKN